MSDLLIRDVPEDVVAAIDLEAKRVGLSRSEYLRRKLAQEAAGVRKLSPADFADLAEIGHDLLDPEFVARAWE